MREFVSIHTHEQHPGIGTLLLNREPTNALTRQVYREITEAGCCCSTLEDSCHITARQRRAPGGLARPCDRAEQRITLSPQLCPGDPSVKGGDRVAF